MRITIKSPPYLRFSGREEKLFSESTKATKFTWASKEHHIVQLTSQAPNMRRSCDYAFKQMSILIFETCLEANKVRSGTGLQVVWMAQARMDKNGLQFFSSRSHSSFWCWYPWPGSYSIMFKGSDIFMPKTSLNENFAIKLRRHFKSYQHLFSKKMISKIKISVIHAQSALKTVSCIVWIDPLLDNKINFNAIQSYLYLNLIFYTK